MEEFRGADKEIERRFGCVVLRLNEDEFGGRGEKAAGADGDVLLARRDDHHDRGVLEVIAGEDKAAVAEVSVVGHARARKAALDHLALEVVRHGATPTAVEDDVVLHGTELLDGEGAAVVAGKGERLCGHHLVLAEIHAGLEDSCEERTVRKSGTGGYEAVVDVFHRNDETLVRSSLEEVLAGLVAVAAVEVERRRLVGIDGKAALGGEDDVVVVAALADKEELGRLEGRVAVGVERIRRHGGGDAAAGTVE